MRLYHTKVVGHMHSILRARYEVGVFRTFGQRAPLIQRIGFYSIVLYSPLGYEKLAQYKFHEKRPNAK